MSLATRMQADFLRTFANADEFGETVQFQAAGGGPVRELAAHVVVETSVGMLRNVDQEQDAAIVELVKDATLGVARPQLGDLIWRPADSIDPLAPYQYTGEVVYQDAATWTLRYVRLRPFRANASAS